MAKDDKAAEDDKAAPKDAQGINGGLVLFWGATSAILLGLTWWAATSATVPKADSKVDATEMLAVVSLVAVGIERIIEGFWSVIGRLKHAWWPLNAFGDAVEDLIIQTNATAAPAFKAATDGLAATKKGLDAASAKAIAIDKEIKRIEAQEKDYLAQVERITKLAKNSERAHLLGTLAFQAANRLDTAYGSTMDDVRKAFNDSSQVVTGMLDMLAGFKDNPAKKLASIVFGSIVGLAVAGFVGLDLFAAAGAPLGVITINGQVVASYLGVAVTGLVLGLGANPTHEIVKYVSEVASARRANNTGRPNASGSPDDRDERNAFLQPEDIAFVGVTDTTRGPDVPALRVSRARMNPGAVNLK